MVHNAYIESIDRIRTAHRMTLTAHHTGIAGMTARMTVCGADSSGFLWSWTLESVDAVDVVLSALSDWGWDEVGSAVVQARLYLAMLIEREYQEMKGVDEIPFD